MYTPVNPSFTIKKWSLRGSELYRHVFVMISLLSEEACCLARVVLAHFDGVISPMKIICMKC